MNPTDTVLDYRPARATGARPPLSTFVRAACAVGGIVLPAICLLLNAAFNPLAPEWQTGMWSARVKLLLAAEVIWLFYPFLLYAMASLALLLYDPLRWATSAWVRLGIYTGAVLALHHTLLAAVATAQPPAVLSPRTLLALAVAAAATVVPAAAAWLTEQGLERLTRRTADPVRRQAVYGGGILIAVIVASSVGGLVFMLIGGAPALALASFGAMSWFAWEHAGPGASGLARWLPPLGWAVGYAAAWRVAIGRAADAYASLPTTPPDCYVCTAAARGHPRVVGSRAVHGPGGPPLWVNRQMRRLKCTEVVLRAACPPLHRRCRRLYDRFGPRLAGRLRHPLLADAAYLSLKPAEWLAAAALTVLLPDARRRVGRFYDASCHLPRPRTRGRGRG